MIKNFLFDHTIISTRNSAHSELILGLYDSLVQNSYVFENIMQNQISDEFYAEILD